MEKLQFSENIFSVALMEPSNKQDTSLVELSVTGNFKEEADDAEEEATKSHQHLVPSGALQRRTNTISGASREIVSAVIMLHLAVTWMFRESHCSKFL